MNLYAKKQSFLARKMIISTLMLALLVVFLNIFQSQVRNSFFYVSAPISKTLLAAGKNTAGFFDSFLTFTTVKKENTALKTENQYLSAALASLQEAFSTSQDLKIATENTANERYALLQARVIGLDIENDTMLIDRGLTSGMKENMPIISKEKVLFGKVSKAYAGFSQIMLISAAKSALAVKIQTWPAGATPVYGVIKGSGNLSVYLDLITSGSQVNEGDTLVTSAQEGIFPKDLLWERWSRLMAAMPRPSKPPPSSRFLTQEPQIMYLS